MNVYTDHNLYILGAGFSEEANMPLMSTFFKYIKHAYDWYDLKSIHRVSIGSIINFRQNAASSAHRVNIDLGNIEDLFSLAAAEESSKLDSFKKGLCSTLKFCKLNSSHNPYYKIKVNDEIEYLDITGEDVDNLLGQIPDHEINSYDYIASVISGIGNKNKNQIDSIISFNYDTVLEDSFDRINSDYTYKLNNDLENLDDMNKIPLIKIHGSMNWFIENKHIKIKPFDDIISNNKTPFIIPPIWSKNYNNVSRILWNNSIKLISSATRIIIIGFSMPKTDLFFRYLLASGLKENISLEDIFIVDPYVDNVMDDARDIFADNETQKIIQPIPSRTTDAFCGSNFMTKINRPMDERIRSFCG